MKFNVRLRVSFGIISLLLIFPVAYSQTCDNTYRYGKAEYYDKDAASTKYYGVSAKNEVQDINSLYLQEKVVNSAYIKQDIFNPDLQGLFEVGWYQTALYKEFFVGWKTSGGVEGSKVLGTAPADGYYRFYAYNDGAGNFKACVCELYSDETHNRCLPNFPYSKATSDLGFEKGYPGVKGDTLSSCDVNPGNRFTRFWHLLYTPTTGVEGMYFWDYYRADFNDPLVPEFVVYKRAELS